MLVYKIDVLEALKSAGYNTNRIRTEKLLGESAIQALRERKMLGVKGLDTVCRLLKMQPGDLVEFIDDAVI